MHSAWLSVLVHYDVRASSGVIREYGPTRATCGTIPSSHTTTRTQAARPHTTLSSNIQQACYTTKRKVGLDLYVSDSIASAVARRPSSKTDSCRSTVQRMLDWSQRKWPSRLTGRNRNYQQWLGSRYFWSSEELDWDATCGHKANGITSWTAWRKGTAEVDDLPCKDETESGHCQTNTETLWKTTLGTRGRVESSWVFPTSLSYHPDLKWT